MTARQWWLTAVLASAVTLIAACQTAPAAPQDRSTASSAQTTPDTTTNPAAPSTFANDLGQPTHTPQRRVIVIVSAARYTPGAPISMVVVNGLDRTVFTNDSKSDCSIITLQRLDDAIWQDVPGCAQQRPPAIVAIGPAHHRAMTLHPASSNFRLTADFEPALRPGTYRAKFTYRFTPDQNNDDSLTALSDPFVIG
ncbi:MAG TPA: hypothetical protein VFM54_20910 [Micromonosporaceae bacterium]|nr:hypothetical protein [Micromonosporaceae bacterium]